MQTKRSKSNARQAQVQRAVIKQIKIVLFEFLQIKLHYQVKDGRRKN